MNAFISQEGRPPRPGPRRVLPRDHGLPGDAHGHLRSWACDFRLQRRVGSRSRDRPARPPSIRTTALTPRRLAISDRRPRSATRSTRSEPGSRACTTSGARCARLRMRRHRRQSESESRLLARWLQRLRSSHRYSRLRPNHAIGRDLRPDHDFRQQHRVVPEDGRFVMIMRNPMNRSLNSPG